MEIGREKKLFFLKAYAVQISTSLASPMNEVSEHLVTSTLHMGS